MHHLELMNLFVNDSVAAAAGTVLTGTIRSVSKTSEQERDLPWLIEFFSSQQATNTRDRVYTLLSLCCASDGATQVANYQLSLNEVYYEFACLRIEKGNSLEMLYSAMNIDVNNVGLPS